MVPLLHPVVKDAVPCFRGPALIPRQAEEVRRGKQLGGLYKSLAPGLLPAGWLFWAPVISLGTVCCGGALLVNARDEGKVILAQAINRPCGYFRAVLLESEE